MVHSSKFYIPQQHFDNLLKEHSIKLTLKQRETFKDIFNDLYNLHKNIDRREFFSHAIVYNHIVKNTFPTSSLPLIYVSQNLKYKNKDFIHYYSQLNL